MAKQKFVVREGFNLQIDKKTFDAGEVVELDLEVGASMHQLEPVGKQQTKPSTEAPATDAGVEHPAE